MTQREYALFTFNRTITLTTGVEPILLTSQFLTSINSLQWLLHNTLEYENLESTRIIISQLHSYHEKILPTYIKTSEALIKQRTRELTAQRKAFGDKHYYKKMKKRKRKKSKLKENEITDYKISYLTSEFFGEFFLKHYLTPEQFLYIYSPPLLTSLIQTIQKGEKKLAYDKKIGRNSVRTPSEQRIYLEYKKLARFNYKNWMELRRTRREIGRIRRLKSRQSF